ncbi:MAG TPA: M28 family peptidase, partial [Alphaproteobacteria bacterium]|nr:M28 family peptidase [Alphaproteobacteria bacterium]
MPSRRTGLLQSFGTGAHYDTCDSLPGADDNAAAVPVLLEVAAQMADETLERSVILAFFDAEEPPHF